MKGVAALNLLVPFFTEAQEESSILSIWIGSGASRSDTNTFSGLASMDTIFAEIYRSTLSSKSTVRYVWTVKRFMLLVQRTIFISNRLPLFFGL